LFVFSTLRRLTVLIVIIGEFFLLHKSPTKIIVSSVLLMILGSLVGGWGDLQFDIIGYGWVILNDIVTAFYLVMIKRTINDTKLKTDTFGVMYYNSLLSVPFLIILCLITDEFESVYNFNVFWTAQFQISFLMSAIISFGMNYCIFWCTEVNSPLTTSVTGQVKNVLSSFVSLFAFNVVATPMLIAGLCIGLSGSVLYAYGIFTKHSKSDEKKLN
jgi:drug/metabolite transporter (DMT)-like permease